MTESSTNLNLTEHLAGFVVDLAHERIPPGQRAFVRSSLLDWLGCCLAGGRDPTVESFAGLIDSMGGEPHATVVGRARRASILNAMLVNGAAGTHLDLDDVHPGLIGHPAAVLAPTALALAEWRDASGAELETAYVAGYEVITRVGLAVEPDLYERGWHATGVLGVFGACATAAKLLALSRGQTVSAMAIAATQASGLRALLGTESKCIHAGRAAQSGTLAALWAGTGVQSNGDILGARHGLRVFSQPLRSAPVLDGLGERFLLSQTCYKRHAASGSLHSAIDAAIEIRNAGVLESSGIRTVEVRTHPLAAEAASGNAEPRSAFSARQSLHFTVALALIQGRCDSDLFCDAILVDPGVRDLQQRIRVAADPSMSYAEAMPAEVTVTLRDGRRFTKRVDSPKGRPSNPMSADELAAKFRALASPSLARREQDEVIRAVAELESGSVRRLTELLRAR